MEKLTEQLKRHEGLRLKPYRCPAGKLTIGYGRNLDDSGISQAEAAAMLENDIAKFRGQVIAALPWAENLDEARMNVLINMALNMGTRGLLQFKKTLAAIMAGEYGKAADMMLQSKWAKQVGSRASELSEQMRTGGEYGK
jgi:lysozyme